MTVATIGPADVAFKAAGTHGHATFTDAYSHHSATVVAAAFRITRSRPAAEEIAHDVLLRLWSQPDRYQPERGSLRGWLCLQSRSLAIDWIRREDAMRRRERQQHQPRGVAGLDEELLRTSTAAQVRRALDGLPTQQRDAIELAFFSGLTYRQVGIRLGLPEGTAKSSIRLGLTKLRSCLIDDLT